MRMLFLRPPQGKASCSAASFSVLLYVPQKPETTSQVNTGAACLQSTLGEPAARGERLPADPACSPLLLGTTTSREPMGKGLKPEAQAGARLPRPQTRCRTKA